LFGVAAPVAGATLSFNNTTYATLGTETVTAPFTSIPGVATVAQYAGLILIEISGTGTGANGGTPNDAFYTSPYTPSSAPGNCGSLAVRTGPLPGGCANYAHNRMVYSVNDDHFVSLAGGTYVPTVRANHQYSFVISVDAILASLGQVGPRNLYFGTTDGNYGDNSGAFTITVSQLSAIPEPSTFGLAALALTGAAYVRRRRRR